MAVSNPPYVLQAEDHPAATFRRTLNALMGGTMGPGNSVPLLQSPPGHGVVAGPNRHLGGMIVTQTVTPSMGVIVSSGDAFIYGQSSAGVQGVYHVYAMSNEVVPLAAAHASLPRIDLVVARVYDSEYSGSDDEWGYEVIQGTPASSPVPPTIPTATSSSLVLAQVAVAAAATSIVNADVTDLRRIAVALGADHVLPSTWDSSPTNRASGGVAHYPDTGKTNRFDYANNRVVTTEALRARDTYTPLWTAASGGLSIGSSPTNVGRYRQLGVDVEGSVVLNYGTSPAAGTGAMRMSLPVPARSSTDTELVGIYNVRNATGSAWVMGQLAVLSGDATKVRFLAPTTLSTVAEISAGSFMDVGGGGQLRASFAYEAATPA